MKLNLIYCLLFLLPLMTLAQEKSCACCTDAHDQFDFWLGDWEVFNENGEKIGENLVEKLEDNCILNENWTGRGGGSGKSYNYYDPADDTWNQLWISNSGNILKLKGAASDEGMILKSNPVKGQKGEYSNQITWTKNKDGSVTQLWEIYSAEGKQLNTVFKGIYRKKQNN